MSEKIIVKKEIDRVAYRRFFKYLLRYRFKIIISIALIPISLLSVISLPYLTIIIVDNHIAINQVSNLFFYIYIYIGLFIFGLIADTFYSYLLQGVSSRILYELGVDLFKHVTKLPQSYFDKTSNGIILSRLTTDFETIGESLAMGVINLMVDLLKMIVLCVILLLISARLSVIFLLLIPTILIITQILRVKLRNYYELSRRSLASSISYLSECLQGMKTILILRAQNYTVQKYKEENKLFLKYKTKENLYEALLFSIIEGISIITVALVLLIGSKYILSSVLTIGTLIAFYQTLQKVFYPIREFTQQFSTIQRSVASMTSIERLFNEKVDVQSLPSKEKIKFESLKFCNVSFKYGKDQPYAIKNINFELKSGQRLAFVGRTGSGKSTIIKLLTQKYPNYEGEILLNGKELSNYNRSDILEIFNIMSQNVYLFNQSIKFNISLDDKDIDDKIINESIHRIKADQFIDQLSNGLDFQVIENGNNLSVGQAQIISLLRAYTRKKEVFILDEATASIDSITEEIIEKALNQIFVEKTVIAIAHRLSTIQKSDLIIVIKNGKIVEQGDHQYLLSLEKHYYQLATSKEELMITK